MFEDADIIHRHTRADLLADGDLIDVSTVATEAGFVVPVAITRAAWADCVEWTEETEKRKATTQDEDGRLWDVLYMAAFSCRRGGVGVKFFDLYRVPVAGRGIKPRRTSLKLHFGAGDAGEPVITILMPNED